MAAGQLSYIAASGSTTGSTNIFTPSAGTEYVVLSILGEMDSGGNSYTGILNVISASPAVTAQIGQFAYSSGNPWNFQYTTKFVMDSNLTINTNNSHGGGNNYNLIISVIQIQ